MNRMDLDLETIILLDRVQSVSRLRRKSYKRLKTGELVEGRFPNLIVAAQIAAITGEKAMFIRDKGI